jgi:hypothetical protein
MIDSISIQRSSRNVDSIFFLDDQLNKLMKIWICLFNRIDVHFGLNWRNGLSQLNSIVWLSNIFSASMSIFVWRWLSIEKDDCFNIRWHFSVREYLEIKPSMLVIVTWNFVYITKTKAIVRKKNNWINLSPIWWIWYHFDWKHKRIKLTDERKRN